MSAPDGSATEEDQKEALGVAAGHIADLVAEGVDVVITHGNGPQVGNLLAKNEYSVAIASPVSLAWCGAQTQATIGLTLMNALDGALAARSCSRPVVSLVTRTLVDPQDPAFTSPSKPIGKYRQQGEAQQFIEFGQSWKDFGEKGWRRVVASPQPVEVLEAPTARFLADSGSVVVCSGGGGIPVVREDGGLRGVEAVIDKDLNSVLLADQIDAEVLVLATNVDNAWLDWGTDKARALGTVSVGEMRGHLADNQFPPGSMGPKVEAICRFVETTGGRGIITNLASITEALNGSVGTVVVPDSEQTR